MHNIVYTEIFKLCSSLFYLLGHILLVIGMPRDHIFTAKIYVKKDTIV